MQIQLKRATKRIPNYVSGAVQGGVYGVEIQPGTYAYFFVIHSAVGIYPVASQSSVLPQSFFSPKSWRWLRWPWMHFPQNAQFLGRLEVTDEDVTNPDYYEHFTDTVQGLFPEFRIMRRGEYERADPRACLELPKYLRSLYLGADMLALLPQMMVVDGNLFPPATEIRRRPKSAT